MSPILCPHCNQYHKEDALFCPTTGSKILKPANRCQICETILDDHEDICPNCGAIRHVVPDLPEVSATPNPADSVDIANDDIKLPTNHIDIDRSWNEPENTVQKISTENTLTSTNSPTTNKTTGAEMDEVAETQGYLIGDSVDDQTLETSPSSPQIQAENTPIQPETKTLQNIPARTDYPDNEPEKNKLHLSLEQKSTPADTPPESHSRLKPPASRFTPKVNKSALVVASLVVFLFGITMGYAWDNHAHTAALMSPKLATLTPEKLTGNAFANETSQNKPASTAMPPVATNPPVTATQTMPPAATPTEIPKKELFFSMGKKETDRQLYRLNINTMEMKYVASFDGGINFPSSAPGGEKIVFSRRVGNNIDNWELYLMDLTNGKSTFLASHAVYPDWCRNPDNPTITYEVRTGNTSTLWMIDTQTMEQKQLTFGGEEYRPKWNSDCSMIVYSQYTNPVSADVYLFNIENSQKSAVTTFDSDDVFPSFSPDGEWIAFFSRGKDTNGDKAINANDESTMYLVKPDGSQLRSVNSVSGLVFSPTWSTDSKQIAFTIQNKNKDMQIFLYTIETDTMTPLTETGQYYHTRWIP